MWILLGWDEGLPNEILQPQKAHIKFSGKKKSAEKNFFIDKATD